MSVCNRKHNSPTIGLVTPAFCICSKYFSIIYFYKEKKNSKPVKNLYLKKTFSGHRTAWKLYGHEQFTKLLTSYHVTARIIFFMWLGAWVVSYKYLCHIWQISIPRNWFLAFVSTVLNDVLITLDVSVFYIGGLVVLYIERWFWKRVIISVC